MDIDLITNILFAMVRTGTPLLLVALGELVCEKSGVLNLGQEGMMLMGAMAGFAIAFTTGNLWFGVAAGIAVGMLMSLLFGFLALNLNANQVASGLALTIFGAGLSAYIGSDFVGKPLTGMEAWVIPVLSDIPLIGKALFAQDPLVYLSFILFGAVFIFIYHSRPGLILKAVGESPDSAVAVGLSVIRVRYLAVMFGGAMAGLGGAYLSLAYTPLWSDNMTAGRGWIALALVVFASWRVGRVLLGAYLFGAASILHLVMQGLGVSVSSNLLATLPYMATIIVLVLLSSNQARIKLFAPMSLGKPFHKTQ
ncbi:ABC transporter permease [Aestuariirhabdus sp. Z084]|uniref:ABC transporter permease n=1 Tax=Aestuariirhabdus haliotis TaxID=2918751 RepID=UPI00201B3B58|nr:ABC transporter permease [Aestuariirhabdus haliotis]MCL6415095.1 ABC transporter permease [Aestuariirhabdus haliotis]MCL6419027.1 ABC transporter permease [Aestuariirhabdus haliotis]